MLILKVTSTIPDLKSECPLISGHIYSGEMYLFLDNIGAVLRKACDHDGDTLHLARAAQVVCREMLERKLSFHGSFKEGCQRDAVSQTHLIMMNMIPEGPNIKCQTQVTSSVKLRLHQVSNSGYIKCQTQVTSSVKLRLHQVSNSGYIKCQTQVTSSVKLGLHQVSNSGYIQQKAITFHISTPNVQQGEICTSCRFLWSSLPQLRPGSTTSTLHCNDGVTYKRTY